MQQKNDIRGEGIMGEVVEVAAAAEFDILNMLQTVIAFLAFILSVISLVISSKSQNFQIKMQQKTIEENTKESHFSTLVELYRLGKTYTSNMRGFKTEINELVQKIENQIDAREFEIFYRSKSFDGLREAISYFDFIQKMIRDGSLSEEDSYKVITFPIILYKDMKPVIEYAQQRKIYDFDLFDEFCMGYIRYMKENLKLKGN